MAADVACSPECIWWLVGMSCGRESGGSRTEVLVLGLTGCSWQWRLLPCFFTAQLEMKALPSLCCGPKNMFHVNAP